MAKKQGEAGLVDDIRDAVLREWPGSWVLKVHGGPYQRSGVPDLLFAVQGHMFGFEVKHQKVRETAEHARSRATVLQLKEIDDLRKAGCTAAVVISVDEVLHEIRNYFSQTTCIEDA